MTEYGSYYIRLRVVTHLSSGIVERTKRERAWKSSHARKSDKRRGERKMSSVSPFSRGVIFTRARVSLALLSLIMRKTGGLLVVKYCMCEGDPQGLVLGRARGIWPKLEMRSSALYCVTFRKCKDFYGRKHSCFCSLRMWKDLTTFVYFFFPYMVSKLIYGHYDPLWVLLKPEYWNWRLFWRLRRENALISRFMEYVNKQRRNSLSLFLNLDIVSLRKQPFQSINQ